jgi:asparagine synthase (glutamine-hydrolysing)
MCGIAGAYRYGREIPVDFAVVKGMCERLAHRGPDAEGYYPAEGEREGRGAAGGRIVLGMRRLSIIDLATGFQPIFSEDKRYVVFQNGEIYNYLELRESLEAKGHRFYTASDTEVIVHLFEEHGEAAFRYLNGMFAIAIWDTEEEVLYVARDRYGIKPLFYSDLEGTFMFASEIPPLLEVGGISREIDWTAVDDYFALYYVNAPKTIFRHIRCLEPGHYMVVGRDGVRKHEYWDFDYSDKLKLTEEEYAEGIREHLERAVRRQLRSDVPLGVFLSSGLDSTSVMAYMSLLGDSAKTGNGPIKSYTIGFRERTYDEREAVQSIVRAYGSDHRATEMSPDCIPRYLEQMIGRFGQPVGAWNAVPLLLVSELAKQDVTVVLTGTGGDELFGGYPTLNAYSINKLYSRFPGPVRRSVKSLLNRIPPKFERTSWEFMLKSLVNGADPDPFRAHFNWKLIFNRDEKRRLYGSELRNSVDRYDDFEIFGKYRDKLSRFDDLEQLLYLDQRVFNAGNTLPLTDLTSMMVSLEARVPFFDNDLVEFSSRIPMNLKVRGLQTKYILRKAIVPILPKEIVGLKKMGFVIPENRWLAEELREYVTGWLRNRVVRQSGLFNPEYVDQVLEEHVSHRKDHGRKLQALVSFSIWWDQYVR